MRAHAAVVAALAVALLAVPLAGPLAPTARADTIPPPKLYVYIEGTTLPKVGQRFQPDTITIGQIPTVVNVTFKNVDTMDHTFTIASAATNPPSPNLVDTGLIPAGRQVQVQFEVYAANQIIYGTRNETVVTDNGQIQFFCIPHKPLGMVGHIVLASAQTATTAPELGVFLRAYWIGLLGIAGTFLLVGISYFVIKSGSRHYTDHHAHIRRGGP